MKSVRSWISLAPRIERRNGLAPFLEDRSDFRLLQALVPKNSADVCACLTCVAQSRSDEHSINEVFVIRNTNPWILSRSNK